MNALTVFLFASLLFLFVFIRTYWRSSDILQSGGIALGFWISASIGGGYLSSYLNSPQRVTAKIELALRDNPAYQAIKKTDLPTYEVMLSILTAQAIDQKISIESPESRQNVQSELSRKMAGYWNQASSQAMFAYVDVTLDKLRYLQSKDSALCYSYLYGDSRQGLTSQHLSKVLQNAEANALAAIIYSAKQAGQVRANPLAADEVRIFRPLLDKLEIEFGNEAQIILSPYVRKLDQDRVCLITTRLLELTRDLPEADSAAAFGLIFAEPMKYRIFPFPYLKL